MADFYCPVAKLVIEIDGLVHDSAAAAERDGTRNQYMENLGLQVLRIPAADVLKDVAAVAEGLLKLCGPSTTQQS